MIQRRNKYNARPTRGFSSRLEADRYEELHLLELGGQIRGLVTQPRVALLPGIYYRADFSYEEPRIGGFSLTATSWRSVFEEAKGVETGRYRLLIKLWRLFGPTPLRIVKRGRGGALIVTAEILPKPPVCRRCGEPWSVA